MVEVLIDIAHVENVKSQNLEVKKVVAERRGKCSGPGAWLSCPRRRWLECFRRRRLPLIWRSAGTSLFLSFTLTVHPSALGPAPSPLYTPFLYEHGLMIPSPVNRIAKLSFASGFVGLFWKRAGKPTPNLLTNEVPMFTGARLPSSPWPLPQVQARFSSTPWLLT